MQAAAMQNRHVYASPVQPLLATGYEARENASFLDADPRRG